jgi:hypothetical protein
METIKIQKIMEEILKLFEQMEVVDELTLSGETLGKVFFEFIDTEGNSYSVLLPRDLLFTTAEAIQKFIRIKFEISEETVKRNLVMPSIDVFLKGKEKLNHSFLRDLVDSIETNHPLGFWEVFRPIYGVDFISSSRLKLGFYTLMSKPEYERYLTTEKGWPRAVDLGDHINKKHLVVSVKVKARDQQQAIEK